MPGCTTKSQFQCSWQYHCIPSPQADFLDDGANTTTQQVTV